MFAGGEYVRVGALDKTLLAITFTFFVPKAQFMLVPVPVPQSPLKFRVASGHVVGTANPSCGAVKLTPVGVLPPTTREDDPLKAGMVAFTEPSASARPAPKILFGDGPPSGIALFKRRLRRSVRAVTLSSPLFALLRRHDLDSRRSAAIPAMWGAAAEVPKNGFSNPPAPVMETPSIPEISGLLRPSSVGP